MQWEVKRQKAKGKSKKEKVKSKKRNVLFQPGLALLEMVVILLSFGYASFVVIGCHLLSVIWLSLVVICLCCYSLIFWKDMKDVEIIPVAYKKAKRRNISEDMMHETLLHPNQIVEGYGGRKVAQRRYFINNKQYLLGM